MRIFAQYPIEAVAPGWCQDFAPVMFAYSCDLVCIQDSAFEKIYASKEPDPVQREKPLRQIRKPKIESPKTALVSHVMNGQHSFERQPLGINKHRHQGSRPVVNVENLQLRCQSTRYLQRGFAKKYKTRGISL